MSSWGTDDSGGAAANGGAGVPAEGLLSVSVGDLQLAMLHSGPEDGPLALCLHGFPDTAHTWRHLMPVLAGAGYHVVAPFMRGYAPSDTAPDGCYQTGALAHDANAIHQALGAGPDAVVIGHDWGAFAAYGAAGSAPERWRRVVALAVPPLPASAAGFFSFEQLKRSFYVFFFQLALADAVVHMDDFAFLAALWREWSPGYDATTDLVQVRAALTGNGRLAAALGYYRAMFDPQLHRSEHAAAQAAAESAPPQPTLYLHGADDGCMGVAVAEGTLGVLAAGSAQRTFSGAGHFLHLEQPDDVATEILDFLAR